MAWTFLGPWKFVRDMGRSSHWGLLLAPGQEANDDGLGIFFFFFFFFYLLHNNGMLSVLIRIASVMQLSTHNIQVRDKIRKFPYILVSLSFRKIS